MVRKDESIEKTYFFFFDFLENHYVSNDEVSKQHLNVIKKSNFVKAADKTIVRSSHPSLETVLITCRDQKKEVKATPFKIADDLLLNKTILLMNPCMLLVNNLTVLKKKSLKELLKNMFLKNLFL